MSRENQSTDKPKNPLSINAEGTISCGGKLLKSLEFTIRREILKIIGQDSAGCLLRRDYTTRLINDFLRPIDTSSPLLSLKSEPYRRRQNNVDKAISRLRSDLERIFKSEFPAGTSWMRYSKKIDGWLLFCLPALGCDGKFHS